MTARIFYLLGVVLVGWAVTVGLRALPFLLFARRKGAIPKSVTTFGTIASPVIIAGLIVYSYAGLAWTTPWPYLAGVLTVSLHLLMKNPLVSILAGTILYMCLLSGGCSSVKTVELDAREPSIVYSDFGISLDDQPVTAIEILEFLKDNDIPTDRVIHIRMKEGTRDLRGARTLMGILAKGGYTRPVLVTERKSESYNTGKTVKKSAETRSSSPARRVKYKKAKDTKPRAR